LAYSEGQVPWHLSTAPKRNFFRARRFSEEENDKRMFHICFAVGIEHVPVKKQMETVELEDNDAVTFTEG
jgi:hypothetical protein